MIDPSFGLFRPTSVLNNSTGGGTSIGSSRSGSGRSRHACENDSPFEGRRANRLLALVRGDSHWYSMGPLDAVGTPEISGYN
ncbi:MAG: hypothetical protein DRJ61_12975 [Acidobacteria bacterium]|nr:MAG: hypothetical protein DRJ61_12975 [Acidobacteriota bacterium]